MWRPLLINSTSHLPYLRRTPFLTVFSDTPRLGSLRRWRHTSYDAPRSPTFPNPCFLNTALREPSRRKQTRSPSFRWHGLAQARPQRSPETVASPSSQATEVPLPKARVSQGGLVRLPRHPRTFTSPRALPLPTSQVGVVAPVAPLAPPAHGLIMPPHPSHSPTKSHSSASAASVSRKRNAPLLPLLPAGAQTGAARGATVANPVRSSSSQNLLRAAAAPPEEAAARARLRRPASMPLWRQR